MAKKKWKKLALAAGALFIIMNFVAFMHAYKFTHFSDPALARTKDPDQLSAVEKITTLVLGIDNPRPVNTAVPSVPYESIMIDSSLECWRIEAPQSQGTVILFHGYASKKSSLLERAYAFLQMNYSVMLVDFKGSGGSVGNSTSIGFHEAEEVRSCFEFVQQQGEKNIYLFGVSMGAAAILKSLHDYALQPSGVVLECPFGSLYKTTCSRFRNMHAPVFPFAPLLVFWGGVQHNYWAFGYNPATYAEKVTCPVLLFFGEKDDRVTQEETDAIFQNLHGKKQLVTYPKAGHNDLFGEDWKVQVSGFLHPAESAFSRVDKNEETTLSKE